MVEKDKWGQWLSHTLWIPKNNCVVQNCVIKTRPTKEKNNKLNLTKMKTSTLWKMLFKEWKDKSEFAKIYRVLKAQQ